jgi:exoribonuclease-2
MSDISLANQSLVLYKTRPARVVGISDKIDIELEGGKIKRVRPKDVVPLHPGPLGDLSELTAQQGNIEEAWELLEGGESNLRELAELVFGDFTPAAAWAAWELLAEGLYFDGNVDDIRARGADQIVADRAARAAKETAEREWEEFLQRIRRGGFIEEDRERLKEVEKVAFNQSERSPILKALEYAEKPEIAHRFLTGIGYWQQDFNPYPQRLSLPLEDPCLPVPELPQEERRDLTHLGAYAIDDEETHDPDDALSLEGDRIWVHVADVAALVAADSELDLEARQRGANLYLPETISHMLPPAVTEKLGLGLQQSSPALSIGFRLDQRLQPVDIEITPSRIRAVRQSYSEIDGRLAEQPFATLAELAAGYRERRRQEGAVNLDLPEVSVRVREGRVVIHPLQRSGSRQLVAEAMTMAGEAVARYALEHSIPIPFATQPAPDEAQPPGGLAQAYGYRRKLKPSQSKSMAEPHAGLGLESYSRATSPLRRYLDLVVHQQLRLYLQGGDLMTEKQIGERIAVSEMASKRVRRGERLTNNHWKMVYLQQNWEWSGRGTVVEIVEQRATVIIPELALETRIRLNQEASLNSELQLALREVDLPDLVAWFRVVG